MRNVHWTDKRWKRLEHRATHAAVREVCQECLLRIRDLASVHNAKRLDALRVSSRVTFRKVRDGKAVEGWMPTPAQIREWIGIALQELAVEQELPKKVKRLARAELADLVLNQHACNIWDACDAFLNEKKDSDV